VEDLVTRYPIPRGIVGALTRAPKRMVHAVEGVSFTVGRGEMVALVGESGCGKTSTAQTVMRLVDPTSGRIRFRGQDITTLRQRVAIAAALVLEPELLVADEPVSMLDVSVRAGILSLLDELRRSGLGILMITHDLSTAARFADRIAVMYLGRIVEQGPSREVIRNPQHPYTKALLSVVPKRDPRERTAPQILTGETPNPISVPSGCRFH